MKKSQKNKRFSVLWVYHKWSVHCIYLQGQNGCTSNVPTLQYSCAFLTWVWWVWWLPVWISISPSLWSIWSWRTTVKYQVIHTVKGSPRITPKRRKSAEAILTEVQDQGGLGYKELDYMVPWEHQDLVAQEVHAGQEQHHGDHGEQADPMDSLDPVTRVAQRKKFTFRFSIFQHFKSIYLNTQRMSKRFEWF